MVVFQAKTTFKQLIIKKTEYLDSENSIVFNFQTVVMMVLIIQVSSLFSVFTLENYILE